MIRFRWRANADGLDVECEGERGDTNDFKVLSN